MSHEDNTDRRKRDFERAMTASAELLAGCFSGVEAPTSADDFLVHELGRLLDDEQLSFENEEFRFLIQQGIRLEYDSDVRLRAELAERLRRTSSNYGDQAARLVPHLVGAIEDVDFPLDRIGAVVRHYTSQLFERLEGTDVPAASDELAGAIDAWRNGRLERPAVIAALQSSGPESMPLVADLLFEAAEDEAMASALVQKLAAPPRSASPRNTGVRALAYAVSEPFLEEATERQAYEALAATWPAARNYILYNLRKHEHEDIPFRWMELLVSSGELRAVDRILEEVLLHAHDQDYREDLLAILDLIEGSEDPGRAGKVLRLLEGPDVPEEVDTLLAGWAAQSHRAAFLEVHRIEDTVLDFVHIGEDFSAFAARLPAADLREVCRRWRAAYHESRGWLQLSRLPRSEIERQHDAEVERIIVEQLSSGRRPDEGTVRGVVEHIRESSMYAERDGEPVVVTIYRKRPKDNRWLEDVYRRDLNSLYLRAAQTYDDGDIIRARIELDIVLQIDPEYPFAVMLDRVIESSSG